MVDEAGWRNLPPWVRFAVLAAVALVIVALGVILWRATTDDDAEIDDVLDELAADERTSPTTEPIPIVTVDSATTAPPTTAPETTTTVVTTTTAAGTTAVAVSTSTTSTPTTTTTTAATTTTTTTTSPATSTTSPPATSTTTTVPEPTTTPAPDTTPPATPPDTTAPPVPDPSVPPGAVAASATAFAEAWNENAASAGVPTIDRDDVTELDRGDHATTFVAPLSDEVGLVAVVRDDGAVAQILLAWIPGGDEEASNRLYRDAFEVLVVTVNPALGTDERATLGDALGLDATHPPFPAGDEVSAEAFPQRYRRYVRDTAAADETAVISVVDARPR